jgi:hypothetical protein
MFTYDFLKDRIVFFFRVNGGGSTFETSAYIGQATLRDIPDDGHSTFV